MHKGLLGMFQREMQAEKPLAWSKACHGRPHLTLHIQRTLSLCPWGECRQPVLVHPVQLALGHVPGLKRTIQSSSPPLFSD